MFYTLLVKKSMQEFIGVVPFKSHVWCPYMSFLNECLQESLCFWALHVSRLMSFKAVVLMSACWVSLFFVPFRSHFCCPEKPFVMNPCRTLFLYPSGLTLTSDVLEGRFFNNACRNSQESIIIAFMPVRSHSSCLQRHVFFLNACRKSLDIMPLRSHVQRPERLAV